MATVGEILKKKGPQTIHSVPSTATVSDAVHSMNQHRVGAVVITDANGIVGIFTERDVLRRVIEDERRPGEIPVSEVMTTKVICCSPESDLDEVSRIMKDSRIRHLPVCSEKGQVVGLISIGDINSYHASDQAATIHFLNEYLYGGT